MGNHELQELHFSEHDVDSEGSLALFLVNGESRCGIYWLHFADGYSYVGQSIQAKNRLSAHRRRWADVARVGFAECAEDRLDEFELAVIQHAGKLGPLRNILLTDRPAGSGDLVITFETGASLSLPWERSRRGLRDALVAPSARPPIARAKHRQFKELRAHEQYGSVLSAVRRLVSESLPSPVATERYLWTLSALPATNKRPGCRRLFTYNAGRLEICYAYEVIDGDRVRYPAYLNLHGEANDERVREALARAGVDAWDMRRHRYSAMTGEILIVELFDLGSLVRLLADPIILDEVYKLTVSMMRQGLNPLQRFHNWEFAEDVLGS